MTRDEATRLEALRQRVFALIKVQLEQDGHCKGYEGTFRVVWPSYFGGEWVLGLDCYVLGPSRHYEWYGKTFADCLAQCERAIDSEERGEYEPKLWRTVRSNAEAGWS